MLTGRQIREARKLLGWTRSDLTAELSIIGAPSLRRIEMFDGPPPIAEGHAAAIRAALEAAGVEFFPEDGGGAGVRLTRGAM